MLLFYNNVYVRGGETLDFRWFRKFATRNRIRYQSFEEGAVIEVFGTDDPEYFERLLQK